MWDIKLPNGIIQVYNIIKNKIINYIMYLEIIDFTKNQQEIIEERLNFFIINLQCFKKVHKYQLDYMKKINIIYLIVKKITTNKKVNFDLVEKMFCDNCCDKKIENSTPIKFVNWLLSEFNV